MWLLTMAELMVGEKLEEKNLRSFKDDCCRLSSDIVVQKYLIDGPSYYFDVYHGGYEEFVFKESIASGLDVHIRDIAIIGSGKLGFSIKPEKDTPGLYKYKAFDYDYSRDCLSKKSDLDVAIVSNRLFDDQLIKLYKHTDCYLQTVFSGSKRNQLGKYVLKGWIRPDVLPSGYEITSEISRVQAELSKKYERDVNIGLYKSWFYFESYHYNNVCSLSVNLIA